MARDLVHRRCKQGVSMAADGLLILILLALGQTEEAPLWDPVLDVPEESRGGPGERRIRVIRHEDLSFQLGRAFFAGLVIGPSFLQGTVESDLPGTPKSEIDLIDDLGLGPAGLFLGASMIFRPRPHFAFRLEGSWGFWEGSESLGRTISLGDVVFPAGAETTSRFGIQDYSLRFDHDLGRWTRGYHGYRLGIRYFATDLSIRSDSGRSSSNKIDGALPLMGYRGGVGPFGGVRIDAEMSIFPSFAYRGGGQDEELTQFAFAEFKFSVEYQPEEWLGAGISYTFLEIFQNKDRKAGEEAALFFQNIIGFYGRVRF